MKYLDLASACYVSKHETCLIIVPIPKSQSHNLRALNRSESYPLVIDGEAELWGSRCSTPCIYCSGLVFWKAGLTGKGMMDVMYS